VSDARPPAGRGLAGAGFMLLGATLIQWSAAIVLPAFALLGPSATSAWRFLLGAIVLVALSRPKVARFSARQWRAALALGVTTALMNQCFYQAIARIPLGGAVAIEFLGPFSVAALGKRTRRHLALVLIAALGVVALTRPGGGLHLTGVLWAGGAGLFWAGYVFSSHRVGGTTSGLGGLAVSMSIAALVTLPFSMGAWGRIALDPAVLGRLALVATIAVVAGFGAELSGLRRVRPHIAGVLMAADPAVAFLVGWGLLGQRVTTLDLVGVGCVVVAGALVTLDTAVGEGELAQ
jgi:inner membrane transporter RhtA